MEKTMIGTARASIASIALMSLACGACSEEPACELLEADDGSVVVTCGGSEIPIERCEQGLPDLDNNGVVDDGDCDLRDTGRFTRSICESLPPYSQLALCHAPSRFPLGYDVRAAAVGHVFFSRWHLAMATLRVTPMGLWAVAIWIDMNDDGLPNESEHRALMNTRPAANLVIGSGMCPAVAGWSYNVETAGEEPVSYWRDANCDTMPTFDETATLVLRTPGVRFVSGMVVLPRGLAFQETFPDGLSNVVVWVDGDMDLAVDPGERMVLASGREVHLVGVAPYPWDGGLLYRDGETTMRWRVGEATQALPPTVALARCDSMVLQGFVGGCVADGDVLEAGSWSVIGQEALGELHASATSSGNDGTFTAISFRTRSSVVVRGYMDGGTTRAERTLPAGSGTGPVIGMILDRHPTFLVPHPSLGYALESWLPLRATRFLNEACDAATTACADGLTCAVNGNATDARCVAAPDS